MALLQTIHRRAGYAPIILVLSTSGGSSLKDQIKSRIAASDLNIPVEAITDDTPKLAERINGFSSLRLLLLPGLHQLDDLRKTLLHDIHAHVACFEPHAGLLKTPSQIATLSAEPSPVCRWFSERIAPEPKIVCTTLAELESSNRLPDASLDDARQDDGEHDAAKQDKTRQQSATGDAASDEPNASLANTDQTWVFLSCTSKESQSQGKTVRAAIEHAVGPVILLSSESAWLHWMLNNFVRTRVAKFIPQMSRDARRALASDLSTYSRLDFEFIALICASTFLASFGLVQNSAAVIIGAMLIAPLMTPILGAGLSLAQGNRPLFFGSLKTICLGFLAALITSTVFGLLVRGIPNSILERTVDGSVMLTAEMWSRTSPSVIDMLVGVVGGCAAAFARTRNHLSAALAGAAIAAALVPPIATAGLQLSLLLQPIAPILQNGQQIAEENPPFIYGPVLLFVANMLTIMLGSSFVLLACGVRGGKKYPTRDQWTTRMTMLLMLFIVLVAVWIVGH